MLRSWLRPCAACLLTVGAGLGVWPPAWGQQSGDAPPPAAIAPRMVILTPRQFEQELQPLVEHRRRDLAVEVVLLDVILDGTEGADDPEKLKRFLYGAWKERQLRYVLLVGDASLLPVRYMVLDRITPAAFDYAFYPSDLYYADVARQDGSFDDWNAQREGFHAGYYGEVRGEKNKEDPINFDQIDYRPELAVGRWPVASVEQVRRAVAKTLAFEKRLADDPREPTRVALVAVGGWVDGRPFMDRLASLMPSSWEIAKRYDSGEAQNAALPPPTEEEVVKLLNGGVDLVIHAGHGSDTSWEQCFFMEHLDQVHNAQRLPVMLSAGCSTARFATLPPYEAYVDVHGAEHQGSDHGEMFTDPPAPPAPYQAGRFNPPGLGKQLVVGSDNGAVAYFGCNTGSQPCGLTLTEGFARAWASQRKGIRLGDCWAEAIAYYYDREGLAQLKPTPDWYPASIFFQGMKFMLYGDPALRLTP